MGELGFLGLTFPEEYGGQGGDYFYSMVLAEDDQPRAPVPWASRSRPTWLLPPIPCSAPPSRSRRYLVPGIKGEQIGSLGITEPGAGSDVAGIRTTAIRDGDEYVINGAEDVHHERPARRLHRPGDQDRSRRRHDGMTLFLVDLRDADGNHVPGFTLPRLEKMGMHASDTGELSFEDVRVPPRTVLGEDRQGLLPHPWELQGERLVAAAGCYASLRGDVRAHARVRPSEREAFGRPSAVPGDPPQVRRHGDEDRGREAVDPRDRVAFRQRRVPGREISMAKLYTSRVCPRSPTSACRSSAATAT